MKSRTVFSLAVVLAVALLQLARPLLSAPHTALPGNKQQRHSRAAGLVKSVSAPNAGVRSSTACQFDLAVEAGSVVVIAPRIVATVVRLSGQSVHELRVTTIHRDRSPPVCA